MLFEAMPLSLHSNKRKNLSHKDLPIPKKFAMESHAKNGQPSLPVDLSDTDDISYCLQQVPGTPTAERLNTCQNPKLSYSVQHSESTHLKLLGKQATSAGLNLNGNSCCVGLTSSESEESDDSSLYDEGSLGGHKLESFSEGQSYSLKKPSLLKGSGKKISDKVVQKSKPVYDAGGYMRRMASLNASACVAAMMEPEKKYRPHKLGHKTGYRSPVKASRKSSSSSNDDPTYPGMTLISSSPHIRRHIESPSPESLHAVSTSSISSTSETDTSKDSDEILTSTPQVYTLLALASLAASGASELDLVPFNTLGLLYNGDTIHPNARAFYTSDINMVLPERIIPKVIPSREEFVKMAVTEALRPRSVNRKRKAAKANNGWMTLGSPIKRIEYENGTNNWVVRRYYAGITRNHSKEVIFVRDCVLIRAGGPKEEKPYVAKISSIWQEQPGQLMMTVFWYYRPYELDNLAVQGVSFQQDELLASQHHDDNSVACIEEKCYILGVTQYCRYQAYIQSQRDKCRLHGCDTVPNTKPSREGFLRDYKNSKRQQLDNTCSYPMEVIRGQDFRSLMTVEPELVYLCQRGYNHCAAKLTSKSCFK